VSPSGADRELDANLAILGGVFVLEDLLVLLPHLDLEADVVALGAAEAARGKCRLEQDVAGVEIGQAHAPRMLALR